MTKIKLAHRLRRLYSENKLAVNFVIRVLIIYISWKILLWFLGEERVPIDERYWSWLSSVWEAFNDLVRLMLIYSSKFYFDLAGYTTYVVNNYNLAVYELQTVRVGNYCLGIQLWIFFVALICSYPGKWINKLWFSVVGVISINILNIIRIILIIYAAHHYPERIQFNHDYVFNIAIYIFTFLMWVLWVNKISKTEVAK